MGRDRAALTRLPRWTVPALAAVPLVGLLMFYAWPLATLLGRLGVRTLGDFAALPAEAVRDRFGVAYGFDCKGSRRCRASAN